MNRQRFYLQDLISRIGAGADQPPRGRFLLRPPRNFRKLRDSPKSVAEFMLVNTKYGRTSRQTSSSWAKNQFWTGLVWRLRDRLR